jgi:hypothetical protein
MFGTQRGSIGTIIQLPEEVFKLMTLLESAMEKSMSSPIEPQIIKREFHRQVVIDQGTKFNQTQVIDGDFLETFLALDMKKQTYILQSMFNHNKDFVVQNPAIITDVRNMLATLKEKH